MLCFKRIWTGTLPLVRRCVTFVRRLASTLVPDQTHEDLPRQGTCDRACESSRTNGIPIVTNARLRVLKESPLHHPTRAPVFVCPPFDRDTLLKRKNRYGLYGMSLFDQTLRVLDSMDRVSSVVRTEARTRSFRPTEYGYELTVDMPGIGSEDVDLEVNESQVMTVRAQRETRSYEHAFVLPDDHDPESIVAEMKRGILTVSIGKRSPNECVRKIRIQ